MAGAVWGAGSKWRGCAPGGESARLACVNRLAAKPSLDEPANGPAQASDGRTAHPLLRSPRGSRRAPGRSGRRVPV